MRAVSIWLALCALSSICLAQQNVKRYYSVPPADAPELAARGRYDVGVRTIDIVHHGQVDILHFDKTTGKAPLYDRRLRLELCQRESLAGYGDRGCEQRCYCGLLDGRIRSAY